ncbi:MAG TPA: hypothetical protein VL326_32140 [Kofleriaceae bacterium]|jgi:hypothetical protein|nr:hypothetical protein [Kofleriaceae bacterium]
MQRLLGLLLAVTGCLTTRVETRSQPTTVHLRLAQVCTGNVLEVMNEHADFAPITLTDDTADIEVPSMHGGYSERRGRKSNISDPYEYKVVRLRDGHGAVTELSLNGIEALPKDGEGRAVVPVTCGP